MFLNGLFLLVVSILTTLFSLIDLAIGTAP